MKKLESILAFIKLPLDYLLLVGAGFTAYFLRFSNFVNTRWPVIFVKNLTWHKYWPLVLIVAGGWIVIFALNGLYHMNPNRKLLQDLKRIFFSGCAGFAAITAYLFFSLQKFDSRFLILTSSVLAIIFVSLGRIIIKGIKIYFYKHGIGLRNTAIIGKEKVGLEIAESLKTKPAFGYQVIGIYENLTDDVKKELLAANLDEIIFTNPNSTETEAIAVIDFANEHHIVFKYSADLFATVTSNMMISTIAGVPIIELRRTRLYGWGNFLKRLVDILGSIFLIILSSPLYLICSIIVLIETGRPIIYKNERVGKNGRKFFTLKFRSMYQKDSTGTQFGQAGEDALKKEEELIKTQSIKVGPVYKIKNDPRVTHFGKFMRRWSLDELPQFFNVLKGEMSLVGPRPHQPREVEKYKKAHKQILTIKPGITGLAQISGRSNLEFEEEAQLDIFYIENWSLLTDLIILIKTPFIVLKKTGAM